MNQVPKQMSLTPMIERGWHYPSRRFAEESDRDLALVRGLVRAERILDTIPAPQLDFDDIIASEEPIHSALNSCMATCRSNA